jgi:F-type H+-transporting ATPase subunit a
MGGEGLFAREVARVGPLSISDTLLTSVLLSALLVLVLGLAVRSRRARASFEVVYEALERAIESTVQIDARPLTPLILTQWLFIVLANLVGLVPGVGSPTRDLSVTTALALIAFFSGHYFAFRARGFRYLRSYIEPHVLLLPFNVIGELSRTLALSLRLFGNMLSGQLIGAILVYLAGLLIPVPLMLLSVLTSVVQAYIFGVLTLVFTASSMQAMSDTDSDGSVDAGKATA